MRNALASELTLLATRAVRASRGRPPHARLHASTRCATRWPRSPRACRCIAPTSSSAPSAQDRRCVEWAVARRAPTAARRRRRRCSTSCAARCCSSAGAARRRRSPAQVRAFAARFQQFSAPVAAKGVEDTALLPLQPARIAERGRAAIRRRFGITLARLPRRERGPRGALAAHHARAPRRTTTSAPRTCAAASTCSRKCPRRGACCCGAGARMNRAPPRCGGNGHAPSANRRRVPAVPDPARPAAPVRPRRAATVDARRTHRQRIERATCSRAAREAKARHELDQPGARSTRRRSVEPFARGVLASRAEPVPRGSCARRRGAVGVVPVRCTNSLSLALAEVTRRPACLTCTRATGTLDCSLVDPDSRRARRLPRARGTRSPGSKQRSPAPASRASRERSRRIRWTGGQKLLRHLAAATELRRRRDPELFRGGGYPSRCA